MPSSPLPSTCKLKAPVSLNVFDKGKLENVYKFRDLTFGARVDKVCELMRISKAR